MSHKLIKYQNLAEATEDMDIQYKCGYRVHSWQLGYRGHIIVLYQREWK